MATESHPHLVSIVIVSFNGKHLLSECLAALKRQTYRRFETIVVDNGSTDGTWGYLKSAEVIPVRLENNRGFTGGGIAGLKAVSGEYVALLNNDATPEKEWLEELVGAMNAHPEAGICASRILLADNPALVDSAGDGCTTAGYGFKIGHGGQAGEYDSAGWIFGACGAAALYRKSMFDEIGFIDDSFFLLFEDVDLSFRAQLMGWKCRYVPSARVLHKFRATIGRGNAQEIYYSARNSELVWLKNMPFGLMVRYLHHKIAQEFLDLAKFGLVRRHPLALLKGKFSVLCMLRSVLKSRAGLQRKRKASRAYLSSILTPAWGAGLVRLKLKRLLGRDSAA